jgi:uncharacterized membrane protein
MATMMVAVRPEAVKDSAPRLASIDVLRGLVMALMALDHVRLFLSTETLNPLDLQHSSPALFLTRWVTHFCAPVFVLLAGTSTYRMSLRRGTRELARYLLTRGLYLVVLELTVVNFLWTFDVTNPNGVLLQVIWAIGWSMVVLSVLVWLPLPVVAGFGLVMITGHNALDGIAPQRFGAAAPLWQMLHVPGATPYGVVLYPLIPWIGVMAVGYALGALYDLPAGRRRRFLVLVGAGCIVLFVLLRLVNAYGDPTPWSVQRDGVLTVLSFVNVQKYPPSLLFLLMTLGPALVLLACLERAQGAVARFFVAIGRVPLFFYLLHLALAHLLASLAYRTLGHGLPLLLVYAAWAGMVVVLYPACRWYWSVKQRHHPWLSYL